MSEQGSSRERLLEAAIEVIERDGEAALRVDRIAEAGGVTKPSIYHFFHDREGLIVAAQAERYRRSLVLGLGPRDLDLDRALDCATQEEFVALIRSTFTAATSANTSAERRLRVQALGSAVTRPELREAIQVVHRQMVDKLAKVLGYGQKRGWFRSDFSASAVASWWWGVSSGRHLVEDYSDAADAAEWPAIAWSTIAHLIGVPDDFDLSDNTQT